MDRRARVPRDPRRDRARAPAGEPAGAGLTARPPAEAPPSRAEWIWRVGIAVARNAVGPVGVLFLDWSAATLAVLYFVDTLAGMGAVFAAVGFTLSHADPRRGFGTIVEGGLTALAAAGFLVAVVAIPLGMPLVFLRGPRGDWRRVLADPTLVGGLGLIAASGLVEAVRHVRALAEGRVGEATVKQAFAILMTRWFLVLVAIYSVGVLLGRFGLTGVVLAYAASSGWSELQPGRFAALIPDRRPAEPR
jgi:hypothetical protein